MFVGLPALIGPMERHSTGLHALLAAAEEVERVEQSKSFGHSNGVPNFSERLARICDGPDTLAEAARLTKETIDRVSNCYREGFGTYLFLYGPAQTSLCSQAQALCARLPLKYYVWNGRGWRTFYG